MFDDPCRKKDRFRWLPWFLVGSLFVLLLGSCTITATLMSASLLDVEEKPSDKKFAETVYSSDPDAVAKLVMVKIQGVIDNQGSTFNDSSTDIAIQQIRQATKDKKVSGLLVYIDSPGGEVTSSDKIYHAVMQFKATGRPVVAYLDTVAASGGYYIACAADTIIATETTITGSIGVILGGMNGTELMNKVGLKSQTFTSGPYKDTLSMTRDMRPDEKAYIQSLVDDTYQKFALIVSQSRKIPLARLKNGIADGRIFNGTRAKEVGLIDQIGYVQDALTVLKQKASLKKARVIKYSSEPSFRSLMTKFGVLSPTTASVKVDWGQESFTQQMKPFVPYMILPGY